MVENKSTAPTPPEYLIDIFSGQHLLGRAALNAHIEAGGHPLDIFPFHEALNNESILIPQPKVEIIRNAQTKRAMKKEALENLADLYPILELVRPENSTAKIINERVLMRAHALGLFAASLAQVHTVFGNISNLYKVGGLKGTCTKHPELTPERAKELLYAFYQKNGRMPTAKEVQEDPLMPSYDVIWDRLPKGLTQLSEEFGEQHAANMTNADITRWGLGYFLLNHFIPTQSEIALMSAEGRSASASFVARRFKERLFEFQSNVMSAGDLWNDIKQEKLKEIEKKTLTHKLPPRLFLGAEDDHVALTRYARYQISSRLMNIEDAELAEVIAGDITDVEFMQILKNEFSFLDEKGLSEIALDLGFDRNMWREIPKKLRLDDTITCKLNRVRGELSEKEQDIFEHALIVGVDFYLLHGRIIPRNDHIEYLQKNGLLPGRKTFKRLFFKPDYFRLLVKVHGTKEWLKRSSEAAKLKAEMDDLDSKGMLAAELFWDIKLLGNEIKIAKEQASKYIIDSVSGTDVRPPDHRSAIRFRVKKQPLTGDEKLRRFAKFKLVDHLLPGMIIEDKVLICVMDRSRTFIGTIINKSNELITKADIELAASMLGIEGYIFSPDEKYLKKVKLKKVQA